MYPILILRSEIICILILFFLLINFRRYKLSKNSSLTLLLFLAFLHVVFDIVTVITVNNLDTIPGLVNDICHVIFYITAMGFASVYLNYVLMLFYSKFKPNKLITIIILIAYTACVLLIPALKIEYLPQKGTYASGGLAAIIGFAYAYVCYIFALFVMIINKNKIKENVMYSLVPISVIVVALITIQIFEQSFLVTGVSVTLTTVGLFFSNDNPAQVFQKRNSIDALGVLKTNKDFVEDLKKYDIAYQNHEISSMAIIKCVINNLADVNNSLGHAVGDDYISIVISRAVSSFKDALAIYRYSGSELIIIYKDIDERTLDTYIKSFYSAIKISGATLSYEPSASCGYCMSSSNYNSITDVYRAADHSLYVNKEADKGGSELLESNGISTETAGLNHFLYDAMLVGDHDDHPYILNLKTNVMRITPKWRDDFGLTNDIMYDLPSVWISHIHPDDRQAFIDDFTATVNGTQKEHHCDYRSMDKDGKYRNCSCHGGVFTTLDGTTVFAGHMYVKKGDNE